MIVSVFTPLPDANIPRQPIIVANVVYPYYTTIFEKKQDVFSEKYNFPEIPTSGRGFYAAVYVNSKKDCCKHRGNYAIAYRILPDAVLQQSIMIALSGEADLICVIMH